MKKMLALIALLSGTASAANWYEIDQNLYVDLDRITTDWVWVKYDYRSGNKQVSDVSRLAYNCRDNSYRLFKKVHFDANGNSVASKSINKPGNWEEVIPGTVMETTVDSLCNLNDELSKYQRKIPNNTIGRGGADDLQVFKKNKRSQVNNAATCAQLQRDASYLTQLYKVCYAKKPSVQLRKLLQRSNDYDCGLTEAKLSKDDPSISKSILAKANRQGYANFCKNEEAYLKTLRAKYGL